LTDLLVGAAAVVAYILYAFFGNVPGRDDIKGWAILMLVFIGIGVGAIIAAQILFRIICGDDGKEDEMDKAVGLRASRFGYSAVGLGILAMLISLACGASAVAALHIILGGCCLGGLADGAISIFFYEKGLRNGQN
jgi:hypothetical protein